MKKPTVENAALVLHHDNIGNTTHVTVTSHDGQRETSIEYYVSPERDFGDDTAAWTQYFQSLRAEVVSELSNGKLGDCYVYTITPEYEGGEDYEAFRATVSWK